MNPACVSCGRFISLRDMACSKALFRHTPDNAFGGERLEWLCETCARAEGNWPTEGLPMDRADDDTLEWRLRTAGSRSVTFETDHAAARRLCLAAADEIARLNRLLNWCHPHHFFDDNIISGDELDDAERKCRLIAAAPELAEAAAEILRDWDRGEGFSEAYERLRTALAKAHGG